MATDRSFPKDKDKKKKDRPRTMKSIEKELWALCKAIIRIRYKHCYTCPQRNLVAQNAQTGHGPIPKGAMGASCKYDLRFLRLQCYNCNINLGGMSSVFFENLKEEIGERKATALYQEARLSKGKPIKARDYYLELIPIYKKLLDEEKYNSKGYESRI